ncbi:hypothetical protein JCM15519_28880 [Fundidesulfovibrio butyratiphilus]
MHGWFRFAWSTALALGLVVCLQGPAQAKFFSADKLLQELDSADGPRNSLARGYILGVYDSFEGTLYAQHQYLTPDDLILIVEKSLRQNREYGAYSAQVAIMRALEDHFGKESRQRQAAGQSAGSPPRSGDPLAGRIRQ